VLWNGVEPTTRKKMANIKAVIDYSGYSAAELGPIAQNIHDKLVANAATFPDLPVTVVNLQTAIDDYNAKLAARESKATADALAFDVSRGVLEEMLADIGGYANIVANGDAVIVDKSGCPSYTTARAADLSAPAAPTDLRLRQGEVSGSAVARYKSQKGRSTNEVQKCIGDPNVEANWTTVGIFQGGKAVISGITPGTVLWVRVRIDPACRPRSISQSLDCRPQRRDGRLERPREDHGGVRGREGGREQRSRHLNKMLIGHSCADCALENLRETATLTALCHSIASSRRIGRLR
jgi:hypothetical protein